MKAAILLYRFVSFYVVCTLCAQEVKAQGPIDTLTLLQQLVSRPGDTATFLYTDNVDTFFLKEIKRAVNKLQLCGSEFIRSYTFKKCCITLSIQERNRILAELEKYKTSYWQPDLFPGSKLISSETFQRIQDRSDTLSLEGIKAGSLIGIHQFIKPIFFHENKLFILQDVKWWISDRSHHIIAIDHDFSVFRKVHNSWKRWFVIDGGAIDF